MTGRGIQKLIGRRPIATFGNSDGDLQMLRRTCAGPGARFRVYDPDTWMTPLYCTKVQ